MIISLSGSPGSGKTSAAKLVAERLGLPFYSVGGLRGKMAMERGLTINQLNEIGETDKSTDTIVDEYQKELGKKEDGFVIEGRLSWYFIPHSFKVFLQCDSNEAAKRIFEEHQNGAQNRADEQKYETVEETRKALDRRIGSDVIRYEKYYDVDYRDPKHFDLVLDTTENQGPEQTAEQILSALKRLHKI
ncbi:MAG TPA: cytidylate kinase family protein [Patescibacteria group bacterium]|nr:cytidylate kinase family protein [Patescibacteria group bacterium]